MGTILVGTCAWHDHKPFYPPGLKPEERLSYYARHFPVVEVDASFYRIPSPRIAGQWAERTPPHFRFHVKAYRALTLHSRPQEEPLPLPEAYRVFREALLPLHQAGKLKAVLFQFPPWFRCEPASLRHLEQVRNHMEGFLVAVEFRHASWFRGPQQERTLALLESLGFVHVVCDEPQVGTGCVPPVVAVTNPELSVVRFHGRNREAWYARDIGASQRFRYLYREEELREWIPRVRQLAAAAREVHLLMNNCFRDYAVRNALQLARMLGLAYPEPQRPPLLEEDPSAPPA